MKKDMDMVLAEVLGALLTGDMDALNELDRAAGKEIQRQRAEIELARAIDPSIDAFLNELTGGEDLDDFATKMALNAVGEADFDKMFDEAYAKSQPKKDKTSDLEKAKKKAKAKHPEMDLMMMLEQAMMSEMPLDEGVKCLIDKYSSLEKSMVKDARTTKDETMANALLGGAAAYNMVVEDLKGLLS